jgi:hypothetical protein
MSRFYNEDEPSESGHVFDQLNITFVNESFVTSLRIKNLINLFLMLFLKMHENIMQKNVFNEFNSRSKRIKYLCFLYIKIKN